VSGFIYRASWPILDPRRPVSALIVEAAGQIDAMAASAGAAITGPVRWHVIAGNSRLVGEAIAAPIEPRKADGKALPGSVSRHAGWIEALAYRGLSDARIADLIGCSEAAVTKVRQRNRVPAGGARRALGNGETEAA